MELRIDKSAQPQRGAQPCRRGDPLPGPDAPDLSIVIVAHDSASYLEPCLESIPAAAGRLSHEVIIVDNASPDGTAEWLVRRGGPERLLLNAANRGFAAGCNRGIRAARGRLVLLLNPDTIVGERAIEHAAGYLERNPRVAAAGCKVLLSDGRLDPSCKREFPGLWDAFCRFAGLSRLFPRSRRFARYDAGHLGADTAQDVPLIDGCFMLIRRAALEDVGLLDERFFMYAEEMDWCRRAQLRRWSIGYEPAGRMIHFKGASTRRKTFRMLYHFHRSMVLYYWKHGRWRIPGTLLVLPGAICRYTVLVALNACRHDRRVSG